MTTENQAQARRMQKLGEPFRLIMVGSWMYQIYLRFIIAQDPVTLGQLVSGVPGFLIFTYYVVALYVRRGYQGLITTGMYRYTRHPMYHGAALLGLSVWWPVETELSVSYFVTLGISSVCMGIAGFCQELETLSRFGEDAEDYYARTPRFICMYPFRRRQ